MSGENDHVTTDQRLSDDEFMRRLRARFTERGGEGAEEVSETVPVDTWREEFDNDPEAAADEEMSYWEDDGDAE